MAVEDKIKTIVAEQLGVSEDEVTPEASFTDDGHGDGRLDPDRLARYAGGGGGGIGNPLEGIAGIILAPKTSCDRSPDASSGRKWRRPD